MAKDTQGIQRRRRADQSVVLDKKRYRGKLAVDGIEVDVRFTLSAKADCRLSFEFDAVDGASFMLLAKTMGRPGQLNGHFAIDALTRGGDRVTSDTMSLGAYQVNNDGYFIEASYLAATVTRVMKNGAPKPILKLWFRGFSSYRNSTVETPLGTVAVWGATKGSDSDEMSGCVAISAPSEVPDASWIVQADEFLRHMHQGLAFAHGGGLQTPRLDHIEGNIFKATFFSGSGYQPEFPVQYSLHHGPIIAALVARYFDQGPVSEVVWIALRWMQSGTTVDEVRFLTGMTALETIIESELPAKKGTIIPKANFKMLRQKLMDMVDHSLDLTVDQREIFKKRIEGNNKKSLPEKIDALFDHYKISRRDFPLTTVVSLVNLRNKIVHTGVVPDDVGIWGSIILVRELITRILLSEIGFNGRYCCYIGGRHDRNFPELPLAG
ncbi:hypothetical protein NKH84_26465 [Mesorhizobium sp. M0902]|uniref:HEPN domain-containing protein n=1 Tax=Mesorhizobium sp. M0902 TaxID=2957021 RepID=UPI00333675A2